MVNPVLTILFDMILIGSALFVVAGMVREYLESRGPAVGGTASRAGARLTAVRPARTVRRRMPTERRRVA